MEAQCNETMCNIINEADVQKTVYGAHQFATRMTREEALQAWKVPKSL